MAVELVKTHLKHGNLAPLRTFMWLQDQHGGPSQTLLSEMIEFLTVESERIPLDVQMKAHDQIVSYL